MAETNRLDELLDRAPCGFLTFRDDGTVAYVNATLLEMLGYQREEVAGRHVESILSVGTRIFYQTHLFPLARLHGHAEEIFLLLRARSGEEVGVFANVRRRDTDAGALYHVALLRVRERQKYEEELLRARREAEEQHAQAEAASRAKTDFLAVMSHELRTPLNAISGYVQILDMGIQGPITEQQRDTLTRIDRAQRHLLRLINDLLNLSKLEAGGVDYFTEDVELAEVAEGVTPMVEPQMARKQLELEVDVPAGLQARADRDKLEQILLNLLSNAVKFTPEGGRITVRGARAEDAAFVTLSVVDTGIGIPADKLAAVFEPFVQVTAGARPKHEGTGLGLAISRDLARGMHGDLTLASEVGVGSTFTILLPAVGA